MEILIYKKVECVTIKAAALSLHVCNSLIYRYIKQNQLKLVVVDGVRLIELDSLLQLNDYRAFR